MRSVFTARRPHQENIVALAHKMLRLIFVILDRRQPCIDRHIDHDALSAKKNSPRWINQLEKIGRWPTPQPATATS
jgi:hypothetical protein